MKRRTRIALLVVLVACSRALAGEAVVSVVQGRERAALPQPQQTLLAAGIRRLMETCWLNSLDHPPMAPEGGEGALWNSIEGQTHLYARFEEPFEIASMSGRPRPVSEVLIGLEGSSLLGPELTRHGETIVYYTKCDGRLSVELLCAAPLAPFLSAEQKENCERLGSWLRKAPGSARMTWRYRRSPRGRKFWLRASTLRSRKSRWKPGFEGFSRETPPSAGRRTTAAKEAMRRTGPTEPSAPSFGASGLPVSSYRSSSPWGRNGTAFPGIRRFSGLSSSKAPLCRN